MSKHEIAAALKAALERQALSAPRMGKLMIGPNERARSQYPTEGGKTSFYKK